MKLAGNVVYVCPESGTANWTPVSSASIPPQIVTGLGAIGNGGGDGSSNARLGDVSATIIADGNYNAFPGVARLPDGRLVAVWWAGTAHATPGGVWKYSVSADQGRTWSSATTIDTSSAPIGALDVEVLALRNGTLLLTGTEYFGSTSTYRTVTKAGIVDNNGVITWSADRVVSGSTFTSSVGITATGKALELPDGGILLPIYGKNTGDAYMSVAVLRSTDGGVTWGSQVTIASTPSTKDYTEAGIARFPNGRLVAIMRHDQDLRGYDESHSTDNGATWSAPTTVINLGAQPGKPALAVLGSGSLFMFTRIGGGNNTAYATSYDYGVTWTSFTTIAAGNGLQFEYASLVLQSGGSIAAVWALERDGTHLITDLFYQEFYDGYGVFGGGTIEAKKLRVATTTEFSGNVGIGQTSPAADLQFGGLTTRTISMGRNTGGAAGQAFTIQAGGAAQNYSNVAGGALYLRSGLTTGSASASNIEFQLPTPGSSGITDNSYATAVWIKGQTGGVGIGVSPHSSTKLGVDGGLAIGSYAAQAAPTNGMIISGKIGVGTNSPGTMAGNTYSPNLHLSGSSGGLGISAIAPVIYFENTGASANSKMYSVEFYAGYWSLSKFNDDGTSQVYQLRVDRATGNVGIGQSSPTARLHVTGGDVYVDNSTKGLLLKSPDGTCYRATMANGGTFSISSTTCP